MTDHAWLQRQPFERVEVVRESVSADGWTRKYLLKLADGLHVESVLMGYPGRMTACLSSQVGCAMGCVFCASGQMGLKRNLRAGEIVAQALLLDEFAQRESDKRLRNIVMMGMGEPLHNFDPVIEAMEVLTDTRAIGVAHSRMGISTVGHVPGILQLAQVDRNYTLSISLHATTDAERDELIPPNRRWPLSELLAACREYIRIRQRKLYVSWTLIEGVNDSDEHATSLARLLAGMNVHINLIPLNPIDAYDHREPSQERITRFHAIVREESGLPVTYRQKRGIDVHAGCGQLAGTKGSD